MHAACLVAEYGSLDKVKVAVEVLRKNDFHADAISFVWKGHKKGLEHVDRKPSDENRLDDAKTGAIGALIAAIPGIELGITTIMGPIMVAGPIVAMAGGAAIGALAAEMGHKTNQSVSDYDRINAMGLYAMAQYRSRHEHEASKYEDRVLQGHILIIVTSTPPRLDEAERALQTTGPASLQRFAFRHTDQGHRAELATDLP